MSLLKMYQKQYRRDTPLANAFLSEENVSIILEQIGINLSKKHGKKIKVGTAPEFEQYLIEIVDANPYFAYNPIQGVPVLNFQTINYHIGLLDLSLKREKLREKYFITQDRLWVYPRPVNVNPTRGEISNDMSGYMTTNPHNQWQRCFLQSAHGIRLSQNGTDYCVNQSYMKV